MKRILSVQDISCVGKCSLTVALPVISALGVEAAVLPTAVLSTHTAFPAPAFRDLTEDMPAMAAHWQKMGIRFDCIATGYLGSEQQAAAVLEIHEKFGCPLFVDPVMGDNGKLYSRITDGFVGKMKDLCRRAQVIVPNVTEACCLAGISPVGECDETFAKMLLEKLGSLCGGTVLITGVSFGEKLGIAGRDGKTKEYFFYSREKLPRSFHGTGDIFAAALAAGFALEKAWPHAAKIATDYTWETIRATLEEDRDPRMGVCFEKTLSLLPGMLE